MLYAWERGAIWWQSLEDRDHKEFLDVDGRIMLEMCIKIRMGEYILD